MLHRTVIILALLPLILLGGACSTPPTVPDATECEAGFRLFDHTLGTTCIPEQPERIVSIGSMPSEALLSLGIIPVGFATWPGLTETPDYIVDLVDLSGSRFVGTEDAPNLEAISEIAPDLIIVREFQTDMYPLLSEIAPTVAITGYSRAEERVMWKEFLTQVGAVTGREDDVEDLLARYFERADTLNALMEEQPTTTVSLVRFMPGRVRIYLKSSYAGGIMEDAGIVRPEAQDVPGFVEEITLETIPLADGDIILVAEGDPDRDLSERFRESPLWQTLDAVQNDRVTEVDHELWIGGANVLSAHFILDDLFRYVAGVDPQEVSPNPFLVDG